MAPRCSQTWECESSISFQVAVCQTRSNFRNVAEFSLKSALQHRFHLSPQNTPSSGLVPLRPRGSTDALRELKAAGCHLATQEWVDNHWSLILWKLAGMAALDPESEADVDRRRWSWAETMRQLQYRYDLFRVYYYVNRGPLAQL
jgi:breast cancer 2 susceptibility protein